MSGFDNPYAPTGNLQKSPMSSYPLASLGKRFLGSIVDGLVPLGLVVPGVVMLVLGTDSSQQEPQIDPIGLLGMAWILLIAIGLFVVQVYLLVTRSQTIGKYFVNTQIMDIETNQPAGFVKAGLMRIFVSGLLGGIPVIGPFYTIADILFVFREDRRCIHDLIAGTQVVDIT